MVVSASSSWVAPAEYAALVCASMQYAHCVVSATATAMSSVYLRGMTFPDPERASWSKAMRALNAAGAPARRFLAYWWSRAGQLRPAMTPPSTSQTAPVTQSVWFDRRKATVAATSSGVPVRPRGWKVLKPSSAEATSALGMNSS